MYLSSTLRSRRIASCYYIFSFFSLFLSYGEVKAGCEINRLLLYIEMEGGVVLAVPWTTIKTEFLETGASYEFLAKKHGCAKQTIANRAHREGWAQIKKDRERDACEKIAEEMQKERENSAVSIAKQKNECELLLWEITTKKLKSLRDNTDIRNVDAGDLRKLQQVFFDMASRYTVNSVGLDGEYDPLSCALDELAKKLDGRRAGRLGGNADKRETVANSCVSEDTV